MNTARMSSVNAPGDTMASIRKLLPVTALLAAVVFWGGSFTAMRLALRDLHPLSVMWCRMIVALTLLLPFIGRLRPPTYRNGEWKWIGLMVLCQPCLYFLLESHALKLTTASQAGVISASVPLMVGVGAWLFLSETLGRRALFGLVVSAAGVGFLTVMQSTETQVVNPLAGNAMEALAMGCAATNMLLVKRLSGRYNPWILTAMQVLAGCLFFLPGLPLLLETSPGVWRTDLILSVLFLGSFVTLGAFGLYNWAMSRLPASRASAFINLVPVAAVGFGWVFLGERLTGFQMVAAAAVVAGVAWSQTGASGNRKCASADH